MVTCVRFLYRDKVDVRSRYELYIAKTGREKNSEF